MEKQSIDIKEVDEKLYVPGADPGFFERGGGLRIFIITKYKENSFLEIGVIGHGVKGPRCFKGTLR